MESYTLRYGFTQEFDATPKTAYEWCVDYRPDDWGKMGKKGTRKIRKVNDDTIILTDTVWGKEGPVTKQRLVRLNPDRLSWTNTHLNGPNRHSQFLYQVSSEGKGSKLEFTGLQVFYGARPSARKASQAAKELAEEDHQMWMLLAQEMRKDLRRARK